MVSAIAYTLGRDHAAPGPRPEMGAYPRARTIGKSPRGCLPPAPPVRSLTELATSGSGSRSGVLAHLLRARAGSGAGRERVPGEEPCQGLGQRPGVLQLQGVRRPWQGEPFSPRKPLA